MNFRIDYESLHTLLLNFREVNLRPLYTIEYIDNDNGLLVEVNIHVYYLVSMCNLYTYKS